MKELPPELSFYKEHSNSSIDRASLRNRINNINPDQLKLLHHNNLFISGSNCSLRGDRRSDQIRANELSKLIAGMSHCEGSADIKNEVLSLDNNEDLINEYDRWKINLPSASKCLSNISRDNELSLINGRRNYSKRNSLLSNLSALFYRNDVKEDQEGHEVKEDHLCPP